MTQWGLDTLFNPAKRHMDEEKRRLQSTREEVGDNSGGKRIDFESGKVSIKRAAGGDDAEDAAPDEAATAEQTAAADEDAKPAKKEMSAAAIRAAERRKRKSGK